MVWMVEPDYSMSLVRSFELEFAGRQVSYFENLLFVAGEYNRDKGTLPSFTINLVPFLLKQQQ
jgi:hypothetical protein